MTTKGTCHLVPGLFPPSTTWASGDLVLGYLCVEKGFAAAPVTTAATGTSSTQGPNYGAWPEWQEYYGLPSANASPL